MRVICMLTVTVAVLNWTQAWASTQNSLNVVLKNAQNQEVGTATLTQLASGVRVVLDAKGLPPGEHAFHFHEKGACEAPKFDSAGGHFNPKKTEHGFAQAKLPHAGDMPNLVVPADGSLKTEVMNTNVSLTKSSLLKAGGTALVIHETADDYKSQPSGNAGGRLACGEIKGG